MCENARISIWKDEFEKYLNIALREKIRMIGYYVRIRKSEKANVG